MKQQPHATRRKFMQTAALLSAGSILLPYHCSKKARQRPNILFIMSDDHTSQAFGCYGSRLADFAPTKHIDQLAADGALLQNCFCTNSICVPSRASILTGQYSHVNGAKTLAGKLVSQNDNVAKHLQTAGYKTAIIGKWHLKEEPAGFDFYNVLRHQGRYHNPILYKIGKDWQNGGTEYSGHSTDVITDEALQWLKNREKSDEPFCMMVHYKAVHEPFYSHDRYRDLYKDIELPEPEDLMWDESPKNKTFPGWPLEILGDRFLNNPNRYAPPKLESDKKDITQHRKAVYQKFIKDYLRTVAGIDDNVGRLLDYLQEKDLDKNTVVIYTADQGYFLGEHNMFDKRFMLEESLRMPFIIRYPKEIKSGTKLKDIVLNIDFASLFLDFADADIPASMQGQSFRENLNGSTSSDWRKSMYYRYWTNSEVRPAHYGIRTHTHKLVYFYGSIDFGKKPQDCWELYDLENDPQELENIYGKAEKKELVAELKGELEKLRMECGDV